MPEIVDPVVMLVRGAILAVLVGVLPVAAGASITVAGDNWFKRLCGRILSFTLYQLVRGDHLRRGVHDDRRRH